MELYKLLLILLLGLFCQSCGNSSELAGKKSEKYENFSHWKSIDSGIGSAAYMAQVLFLFGPIKEVRKTCNTPGEEINSIHVYKFDKDQHVVSEESYPGKADAWSTIYHYENGILKEKEFFNDTGQKSNELSFRYKQLETTDNNVYFSIDKQSLDGTSVGKITESRISNGYKRVTEDYPSQSEEIITIEFDQALISKIVIEERGNLEDIITRTYSYDDTGAIKRIEEHSTFFEGKVFGYVFTSTESGGIKNESYDLRSGKAELFDSIELREYDKHNNWQQSILRNSKGEICGVMTREISYYEE